MNMDMTALADAFSFDRAPVKETTEDEVIRWMEHIAEVSNEKWGTLDKEDGYNCPKCRNRGEFFKVFHTNPETCCFSYPFMSIVPCHCMEKRKVYHRSRMSGLPEGYTFETFRTTLDWQKDMRRLCERYLNDKAWKNGSWLYIGGSIGSGKSHIVSALARELVYERNVHYMNWVRDARQLKAIVNEEPDYSTQLWKLWSAEVLFIDDFFKANTITDADKRLAYDILNERYNSHKPTLFTSELYIDEVPDEAISGRIIERCGDYVMSIGRDEGKDMRRKC